MGEPARRAPDPVDAVRVLGLGVLAFASIGFVAFRLQFPIWLTVVLVPVGFLLVPLAYASVCRIDWVDGFALRPPELKVWPILLIASVGSMWLLNGLTILQDQVLEALHLGEYARRTSEQLTRQVREWFDRYGFLRVLLMASFAPAIAEEFFFRGVVLQGFRNRLSAPVTLAVTGIIFGMMHLEPLKLVPITLLGVFFGSLILMTRSIWSAVFAHAANNAAVLFVAQIELTGRKVTDGAWYLYVISGVVFAGAMAWLYLHRTPRGLSPSADA